MYNGKYKKKIGHNKEAMNCADMYNGKYKKKIGHNKEARFILI